MHNPTCKDFIFLFVSVCGRGRERFPKPEIQTFLQKKVNEQEYNDSIQFLHISLPPPPCYFSSTNLKIYNILAINSFLDMKLDHSD